MFFVGIDTAKVIWVVEDLDAFPPDLAASPPIRVYATVKPEQAARKYMQRYEIDTAEVSFNTSTRTDDMILLPEGE